MPSGQPGKVAYSLLDGVGRHAQILGNLCIAQRVQVVEMRLENADGEFGEIRDGISLNKEAFPQIAGANAARLERLQDVESLADRERWKAR